MKIPENAVTLFRVMTEKSRWGWGKYADFTVGDTMKVQPHYIAWAYYSMEMVSFCDSILDKLGITPIKKPGVDAEAYKTWRKTRSADYSDEQQQHGRYKLSRRLKAKAIGRMLGAKRRESFMNRNDIQQSINHGHREFYKK